MSNTPLKAIEAGAVDYLLKPLREDSFHRALERARQRCTLRQLKRSGKSLDELLASSTPVARHREVIAWWCEPKAVCTW